MSHPISLTKKQSFINHRKAALTIGSVLIRPPKCYLEARVHHLTLPLSSLHPHLSPLFSHSDKHRLMNASKRNGGDRLKHSGIFPLSKLVFATWRQTRQKNNNNNKKKILREHIYRPGLHVVDMANIKQMFLIPQSPLGLPVSPTSVHMLSACALCLFSGSGCEHEASVHDWES